MNDKRIRSEGIEMSGNNPEWPTLAKLMGTPTKHHHWGPISVEFARYRTDCVPRDAPIEQVEYLQHAFYCGFQAMLQTLAKAHHVGETLATAPLTQRASEVLALQSRGPFNVALDAIYQELNAYELQTMPSEGEA